MVSQSRIRRKIRRLERGATDTEIAASISDAIATEGGALYAGTVHTHVQADVTNLVSDLAGKQATLVSGTNIKTINGSSVLGSGDLTISQSSIVGITGTKAEFDTAVTDGNFLYVGDVTSNATHTGDATGSTALSVVKIQGKDFPALGAGDDQKYPKYVSASNAFVMTAIAGGGDVTGDDVSTTAQNIVAYSGTGGKNITELTGTQGDVLYHNGTNWAKLAAGTLGQYLITNGSGANPAWSYGAVVHVSKSAGATTTGANTTPVSVSGAVFTYAANAVYRIWVMGRVNSTAATTGIGLQFDLSSAVTAIDVQFMHQLASTGTLTGGHSIADDASVGVSSGVPAGPIDVPVTMWGLLVTAGNTGTAQLRLRSETTAVTELMAGAVMIVERVQ